MTENRTRDREIRAALAESRRLFVACGLFSMAVMDSVLYRREVGCNVVTLETAN